jgi:uncharacterized protein with ParB-like and HNH nuclease domain
MKIEPNYISIGRLFLENFIFRVPKYQRGYAWGDSHLDDFLSDLGKCYTARSEGNKLHHLFGGIVSAEGPSPGASRRLCDLIDGQQRLATFIILVFHLISAYMDISVEAAASGDTDSQTLAESRARRLKDKYLEYEHEINRQPVKIDRFDLSSRDQQFFKDTLSGSSPEPSRDSHHKLKYAFKVIGEKIKEIITPLRTVAKKLDALKRFEEALDEDCTVIHIVTDSKREAYRLFQVLNDRGTSLTEGDLLRARTLELLAATEFAEQQQASEVAWDDIQTDLPEFTRDFLMWFYASVKGKRPTKTSLFDNFLDAFFPQHKNGTLSKTGAKKIVSTIRQMQQEIAVCRKLNDGEWPYPHARPIKQWDRDRLNLLINALDHTLCMPLLLAAACKLDHKKFSEIVQLVERFAFRYKNISNQHVTPLTKIYHEQAVAIRKTPSTYRVSMLKSALHALQTSKAPDTVFAPLLMKQLVYNPSAGNKVLKYFLVTVEYYLKWYRAGASGNPKCRDKATVFDFSNTTIEHIYPLNPEPAAFDASLQPLANDLGNLTFLGPDDNDTLANKDFAAKKPVFAGSSVLMNRETAGKANWDVSELEGRKQELRDIALKVFSL